VFAHPRHHITYYAELSLALLAQLRSFEQIYPLLSFELSYVLSTLPNLKVTTNAAISDPRDTDTTAITKLPQMNVNMVFKTHNLHKEIFLSFTIFYASYAMDTPTLTISVATEVSRTNTDVCQKTQKIPHIFRDDLIDASSVTCLSA